MNYITDAHAGERCVKSVVSEGVAPATDTPVAQLLAFCAFVSQPGRVSLLCQTVILYCTQFESGRRQGANTSSHSLARCHPVFYPGEISLEGEREDRMSRRRVTECQTERNSQLALPAPSGAAVGPGRTGQC